MFVSRLNNPRSNRPKRRTALVARELARYKVDIAAFGGTRFSEQGQLEAVGADYTFFWSGRLRAKRRDAGVAFAIRNYIVGRLLCLPQGINDHLMSLVYLSGRQDRHHQHFRGILSRPSPISDAAIACLPQVETNADLDLPPTFRETIRSVQQLSRGKAPGLDAIPAKVYKNGGPRLMDHLTALFQEMWRQGEVLQDFKAASIVHLTSGKITASSATTTEASPC
nr:unnamed protein product [Spirometra erinaceieuropaei]